MTRGRNAANIQESSPCATRNGLADYTQRERHLCLPAIRAATGSQCQDAGRMNSMKMFRPRITRMAALLLALCFATIPIFAGVGSAQDPDQGIPSVPNSAMVVAAWHIAFNDDGSYLAERIDIGPMVQGSYTVDGDTVT